MVFKYHYNVNATYLRDVFGSDVKIGQLSEEEKESTMNVIEGVVPRYDEANGITMYDYVVVMDDMETVLLEKELTYSPFVIFRFRTEKSTPWGFGLAIDIHDTIKDLADYKELRKKQAKKIVDPPLSFQG